MKMVIFTVLSILMSSPVFALEKPAPGPLDERIKYIDYKEPEVVCLNTYYGWQTHIQFAPGETITKIALGDEKAWDIVKQDNHIFMKPIGKEADTNMVVLTSRKVYNFDLHAYMPNEGERPYHAMFQVTFRYPDDEKRLAELREQAERLNQKLDLDQKYEPANWNYWAKGEKSLIPDTAYDDERFTYLEFSNNKDIPAVYVENPDGTESLVNSHVEGGTIVVHKIFSKLVLRKGEMVAAVFNRSYDPLGVANTTGTTVPEVRRVIKGDH